MKCQEVKPLIFSYLDENLASPLAVFFIPTCPAVLIASKKWNWPGRHILLESVVPGRSPEDLTERIMAGLSREDNVIVLPASSPLAKKQPFTGAGPEGFGRLARVASVFVLTSIMGLMFCRWGWQIARNPIPDFSSQL